MVPTEFPVGQTIRHLARVCPGAFIEDKNVDIQGASCRATQKTVKHPPFANSSVSPRGPSSRHKMFRCQQHLIRSGGPRRGFASLVPQSIDEVVEAVLTGPVQHSLLSALGEMQGEHEDRRLQEGEQGGVEGHTQALGHLRHHVLHLRGVVEIHGAGGVERERDPEHRSDESQVGRSHTRKRNAL